MKGLIILLFSIIPITLRANTVSPLEFGLSDAQSDVDRYLVLLKTHQEALKTGSNVDYFGIGELHIELPQGAKSIPLCKETDFEGLKLYVTNRTKNLYLFTRVKGQKKMDITKEEFYSGTYLKRDEFRSGSCLLIIEDGTPWVENRLGYSYGAIRKDVILIVDGRAKNGPVASYNTEVSQPKFKYCKVEKNGGYISNLDFYRTEESTFKTYPLQVSGQNAYAIENVSVHTPEADLYGDAAISISDCTNTKLNGIGIWGTYSLTNKYGYGISLNNVWNTMVENMLSETKWGVFGTNNVNLCTLRNCQINRFDIHCYGRDILMENCYFKGLYNQYSSVFGTISHKRCVFEDQRPCLIESSYNAYTGFDISFEDCVFKMTPTKNELVYLMKIPTDINSRPELKEKCLPNVKVRNCSFEFSDDMKEWYVYRAGNKTLNETIGYVTSIDIRDTKLSKGVKCQISNIDLKTKKGVKYRIKRWKTSKGLDYKNEMVKNLIKN